MITEILQLSQFIQYPSGERSGHLGVSKRRQSFLVTEQSDPVRKTKLVTNALSRSVLSDRKHDATHKEVGHIDSCHGNGHRDAGKQGTLDGSAPDETA